MVNNEIEQFLRLPDAFENNDDDDDSQFVVKTIRKTTFTFCCCALFISHSPPSKVCQQFGTS